MLSQKCHILNCLSKCRPCNIRNGVHVLASFIHLLLKHVSSMCRMNSNRIVKNPSESETIHPLYLQARLFKVEKQHTAITNSLNGLTVIDMNDLCLLKERRKKKSVTLICHVNTANVILLSPVKCHPTLGAQRAEAWRCCDLM